MDYQALQQRRRDIVRDIEVMLLHGLYEDREFLTPDEYDRYCAAIAEQAEIDDLIAQCGAMS